MKIKEKVIAALREKGMEYVKHLSTIDTSIRIVVTGNGSLGLALSLSVVGDIVALVRGGRAPFIMRRCGLSRRYKIVGQAYIRGVMFGEALERQDFAFEEFLIN